MSYGGMFTDIIKFKDENFFDEHESGELFLDGKKVELRIVAFGLIDAENKKIYGLEDAAITEIVRDAKYKREISEGRYILLSTCDAQNKTMRDTLLVKIIE